jgi:long-subunit fatty acid transport protein
MMNHSNRKGIALVVVAGVFSSSSVFAAGFEKSILWSASAAAQGGAVVGSSKGAEALYFNPAGLEQSRPSGEASLNFSPTFARFDGAPPIQARGTVEGKSTFSPVGALLVSYKPMEKLGVGVGYYVSGGTKATFEGLDYTNLDADFTNKSTVETDLSITEASLGAGYEIIPGLRFGAAWRVTMVDADFSTVSGSAAVAVANVHVRDIKKTRWNGFRLGTQYEAPDKSWGLGASYRSEVKFNAKGAGTQDTQLASGAASVTTLGDTYAASLFPQQLNVGGYTKAAQSLKVSLEYSFTNYSKNDAIVFSGGLNTRIVQDWKNQHIGRVGFEYTGMNMPLRLGYAYTSQVTPTDRARSTFASPGKGHAIAVGSGLSLMQDLDVDFAGEYAFSKGTGQNYTEVAAPAEFKARAYVAHLSAKYHF